MGNDGNMGNGGNQGLKKGVVVAKKLVVNDFWLVVNGGLAIVVKVTINNYSMHASYITENYSYIFIVYILIST